MSRASHNLPGVLGEIADLVGEGPALQVAEAVGGTRVYFPRRPTADHWLVRAVGAEIAAEIVDHITTGRTGVEIEVPLGPAGSYNRERRRRARRLADLSGAGLSAATIARQAGVTERSVRRHRAKARDRDNDDQGDLGF